MKRERVFQSEGIALPQGMIIRSLNSEDWGGYKYFEVLETDDTKHEEKKEKIQRNTQFPLGEEDTYIQAQRGETIKAINSRAVSFVRYGAKIKEWTKE